MRVLIARYRPRFGAGAESWAKWDRRLAPSGRLLRAAREKGMALDSTWEWYRPAFLLEMGVACDGQWFDCPAQKAIREYGLALLDGQPITLICFCANPERCHRSLLAGLIREWTEINGRLMGKS